MYFFILIVSIKDSKVLRTCLGLCEDVYPITKKIELQSTLARKI